MRPASKSDDLPVVFVMGPTAAGKTGLAMYLAAQRPCSVISVDSAQVYRGLDIGTAKPDADELRRVPHALIDICDPVERYSAARFRDDALRAIRHARDLGRLPLLVGGTMLYFRALQHGLSELPAADPVLRAELTQRAMVDGWPALHRELASVDAAAATRIDCRDAQRIQRALEVYYKTGTPMSRLQNTGLQGAGLTGRLVKLVCCPGHRDALHQAIETRFKLMMQKGFLGEVESLYRRGDLAPDLPAMRSVGYRQLWQYLDGECDLEEARRRAVVATRRLAKRQMTWLRREEGSAWLDTLEPSYQRRAMRIIDDATQQDNKSVC